MKFLKEIDNSYPNLMKLNVYFIIITFFIINNVKEAYNHQTYFHVLYSIIPNFDHKL